MTNYLTGFKCIKCGKEFSAGYNNYICDQCFQNLDAVYDYQEMGKTFNVESLKNNPKKDCWRYEPLFPFENIESVPTVDMTVTPLYKSMHLEKQTGLKEVYLKDDSRLPSASFKDRASSVVMAVAREKNVDVVCCASTGNAGCSWACMGAASGIEVIIYLPETAPRAKIAQIKVYGAVTRKVKGTYDDAYDLCVNDSLTNGYFNRCTGYNPFTREGKKSVSFEIWEQLGYKSPGSVFVPVGDGNIISGVWKGFRDLKELGLIDSMPQLIGVQSSGSDAVAKTVEKVESQKISHENIEVEVVSASTVADSISVDKPRDGIAAVRAIIETNGKAIRVADNDIINEIHYIASSMGIFSEPAGSTSVAGLKKLARDGKMDDIREPAVCLITGNGLKDIDAVLGDDE
ncbi:threonine synthase [Elusimicrobiota bacterium]